MLEVTIWGVGGCCKPLEASNCNFLFVPPKYPVTPQCRTPDTSFYQWVPLLLVIQAGLFYVPRRIWKSCEGGLMVTLSEYQAVTNKVECPIVADDWYASELG